MGRADKPGEDVESAAGDFLARWSRRKLEAREASAVTEDTGVVASPAGVEPDAALESATPGQELTDADMPPLESLTADSDFTPFMSPGVSDGLRKLALRKLFGQPAFNVTDGLNDYDEDYTQFASLGNVITHEMKRMLKRELEGGEEETPPADTTAAEPQDADAALAQETPPPDVAAGSVDSDNDSDAPGHEHDGAEDKTT